MELNKSHLIGIVFSLVIALSSILLRNSPYLFITIGIAIIIGVLPFVLSIIKESKESDEKEEMFLEFARNLVESVGTGTPISRSIIHLRGKDYGVLTENIVKLGNQIHIGVPLKNALQTFSDDLNNKAISRALTLIGQAERSGGDIGEILEAVAEAVSSSDKLKKERKASVSNLVSQGYIIFFVFMIIILIMQFKIIPMLSGISDIGGGEGITSIGSIGGGGEPLDQEELSTAFLFLLLVQGFFSGLAIGKLSESSLKAGVKHSFALMLASFLVSAISSIFI